MREVVTMVAVEGRQAPHDDCSDEEAVGGGDGERGGCAL
jgi:hypothetical protein